MGGKMEKLIITVAITGGVHGKATTPAVPEQPEEQAQSIYDAWNAGASVAHIHARDKSGRSVQDIEIYREVKERVRAKGCDIIIQNTTGGAPGMTLEERLQSIYAEPEMASLNMGITNYPMPNGDYILNAFSPKDVRMYAEKMKEVGVKPEMEVYAPYMLREVSMLIKSGFLEKPYCVNFVMGLPAQGTVEGTRRNLIFMIEGLPADTLFNVCALGPTQIPMTTYAILEGGNARVGLEDNIYYRRGELAKSNAQLVERTARIANDLQREIASPEEARRILGLKSLK
jgi:3-keto-5-aminohexanoate cleavage enzyme